MELQNNYGAFRDAGAEVIALAVAPLASVQGVQQATGATYPVLSDSEHQVAEALGVFNLLGDGIAAPSVFVIDTNGRILWSHIGRGPSDRPGARTILEHLP